MKKYHLLILSLGFWSLVYAQPTNPNVIQGTVSIEDTDAKTCVLTVSDDAFIYWDDFSINEGELTEFRQPSSKSVVVVEVLSDLPSTILGNLKANGTVFLLNTNGVRIGENGHIDMSGFLASCLPTCPCPLIDGEHDVFIQGDSKAQIINEGRIRASERDVYLIGYQIDNQGVIDASQGTVAIAAGNEVVLNQSNGQKVGTFTCPIKHENEETGIDNSGVINACKTELKADGHSYGIAIRHSGFIKALGIKEQSAEVSLVAEKGTNIISGAINAENADSTGGSVQILGEQVFLFEQSHIDASGDKGGGTILVGSNSSVNNSEAMNAKTTFIDENTSILVDAIEKGDGGKVIIWAEDTTCFYGAISACGGENSGNGGYVEIYGKNYLEFQGEVDRTAINGEEGTLLINSGEIALARPNVNKK